MDNSYRSLGLGNPGELLCTSDFAKASDSTVCQKPHVGTPRFEREASWNKGCDWGYCPAKPLFTRTFTSTRRFSARPCAVSLVAVGSAVPMAPGAIMCRTGTLQSWIK
jgi:hypothetical protein